MKGKFIIFEGMDGSGKSTQAEMLHRYMDSTYNVELTSEPTNGIYGELARSMIKSNDVDENQLSIFFAQDRHDHYFGKRGIKHSINCGRSVICDRFYYSSQAYQDNQDTIADLNKSVMDECQPDLIIFLLTSVDESMKRIYERGTVRDRYETHNKLLQVRARYIDIIKELKSNGSNVLVIDDDHLDKTSIGIKVIKEVNKLMGVIK